MNQYSAENSLGDHPSPAEVADMADLSVSELIDKLDMTRVLAHYGITLRMSRSLLKFSGGHS